MHYVVKHCQKINATNALAVSLLLTSLFVISSTVDAIVPVNDQIEAKQGFSGDVGFSLEGQSGNKEELEYSLSSVLRYGSGQDLYVLLGNYSYSETNDVLDEEELFLHARWVRLNFWQDNVDSEVFVQHQNDDFADIRSRNLLGANARFRFQQEMENSQSLTILGVGAFYEDEKSEETALSRDTIRANLYGRYTYEDTSEFPFIASISTYIQPAIDDIKDLRGLLIAGIEFPIRPALSIGFEMEVKHNSRPFIDVDKTDIDYGITLNYAF